MTASSFVRPSRLLALAVLAGLFVGMTGCASMEDLKKRDVALDEARRSLAQADRDLNDLRKQRDELAARLAALEKIGGNLGDLQKENADLRARLAKLQDDLTRLQSTIAIPEAVNRELQRLAEAYPDLLEYDAKNGIIRFKSDMTFDLGSTEVKAHAREALGVLAGILNRPEIAKNELRIVGFTDDAPIKAGGPVAALNPNNWYLSTNRANAVREVLQGDGVSDTRMEPAGWGPTRPIAPNAAGRKGNERNRRVEIYILGTTVPETAVSVPEPNAGRASAPAHVPSAPRRATPARPAAPAPTTPAVPTPTDTLR